MLLKAFESEGTLVWAVVFLCQVWLARVGRDNEVGIELPLSVSGYLALYLFGLFYVCFSLSIYMCVCSKRRYISQSSLQVSFLALSLFLAFITRCSLLQCITSNSRY